MHVWNVLYAARWKYRTQKIAILAPSHNFIGLYLRNWGMYRQSEKNLLNSNTSSTCPHNMVNFGLLTAEICWRVLGTLSNFNGLRVLAAYSYRPSSVVCRSVCHASEPCKNGWTDRDAVWVMDSGGPKETRIRWGPDPHAKGQLSGERTCLGMLEDTLPWAVQIWLNQQFGLWTGMGRRKHLSLKCYACEIFGASFSNISSYFACPRVSVKTGVKQIK